MYNIRKPEPLHMVPTIFQHWLTRRLLRHIVSETLFTFDILFKLSYWTRRLL